MPGVSYILEQEKTNTDVEIAKDERDTHLYTRYRDFDKYKALYRSNVSIIGDTRYLFTEEFVKILDTAILRDNMHVLSREQQEYFAKYCTEADGQLSAEMQQLDNYLGGYKEEIIDG